MQVILLKNLGTRGKIDLINYSAIPDRLCNLACCNHSTKLAYTRPLASRNSIVVAHTLLSMLSVTSLPDILQRIDTSEFLNATRSSKTAYFTLEEIRMITQCVHQMWPRAKQIIGTLRHSESNKGIEAFNRKSKSKIAN